MNGQPGYWISGSTHELMLVDAAGEPVPATTRLAAPSLLWEQNGLTLRLESGLSRAQAVAVARSLR